MRILLVSAAVGGRGGIERVTSLVVEELRARGHQVEIHLYGPSRNPEWEVNLPDTWVGPQGQHRHFWARWRHVLQWSMDKIGGFDPDAVIAMTPSAIIVTRLIKLMTRGRYPIWSWLHEEIAQLDNQWGIGLADAHLAISSGVAREIAVRIGRQDNIYVVYNPTLEAPLQMRPGVNEMAHFAYIGRLDNSVKRIEDILRALALVPLRWSLTIVGSGTDQNFLVGLAEQLQIASAIRWIAWTSDPWSAVGSVSALVLASVSEGFGVVLAEALVRGVPIVSSDCPHGPRDIVQPQVNGWLYPPGDVRALRDILFRIVRFPQTLPEAPIIQATSARFHLAKVVDGMLAAMVGFHKPPNHGRLSVRRDDY